MKYLMILFLVSVSFLSFGQDYTSMSETFDGYTNALLENRTDQSSQYLDQATLDYFQGLVSKVRTADKESLQSESFMDKLLILGIRHGAPEDMLVNGDASDFIAYALNSLIGGNSLKKLQLGSTTNPQNVPLLIQEGDMGFRVAFVKENDEVKLNLIRLTETSTQLLQTLQQLSGQKEDEFIMASLENLTGKKVDTEKVWIPARK